MARFPFTRRGLTAARVACSQGVVGVALKPAAGVLDLATKSAESMRNVSAAQGSTQTAVSRARPPRALGPHATLQVYDKSKAAMQEVLLRVEAGAYLGEALCSHVGLGTHTLLCTEQRLLYVRTGTWEQQWQVPLERLKGVEQMPDAQAVKLQLFFGRDFLSAPSTRLVPCFHRAGMLMVYTTIQDLRKRFSEVLVSEALATRTAARRLQASVQQ